ncbi:MAG TPA: NBR1-Ig-like domain-containing protein [Anaerolineales bacterium]|nr:NBR1-Ig-like domain-containing protein [Anaerolineales bacterium]
MKLTITTQHILIFLGIVILALMACIPITLLTTTLPLAHNDAPATQFASTVQAMVTQTSIALTQTAPIQTPLSPTPTTVPPTATTVPTSTPVSYCDWVQFVRDVSVPDGSTFAPGETFTKIWRLKNRGICTWTPNYQLVFVSGSQMGGTTAVPLPAYVAPGQTIDVSVTLTAPSAPGRYTGYWMLRNPSGALFGYGANANTAFYVDITVKENLPHGTVTGNFCYPSEFNPPLILYFEKADTGEVIQFSIPENTPTFSVLLPNGTYYAYAWAPGYNLEGAYINPDRTMRTLVVRGGQTTTGIAVCDWGANHHSRGQ